MIMWMMMEKDQSGRAEGLQHKFLTNLVKGVEEIFLHPFASIPSFSVFACSYKCALLLSSTRMGEQS
jgi:hypothetical protein